VYYKKQYWGGNGMGGGKYDFSRIGTMMKEVAVVQ